MVNVIDEKPITLKQVARHFGVTVSAVRGWTARDERRLETVLVGGRIYTTWQAVNRFVEQRGDDQQAATEEAAATIKMQPRPRGPLSPTHEESLRKLRARGFDV